jgi:hypothetical protein
MSAANAINMKKSFNSNMHNTKSFVNNQQATIKSRKSLARPKSAIQLRNNRILLVNDKPNSRFKHTAMSIRPRSAHIKVKTGGTGMYKHRSKFSNKGGTGNIFIL